jgi:predicted SAM-dependent methyltransferase
LRRSALPSWFGDKYQEVRLDIDPETRPDIVANITALGEIGEFDAVYSSHCVEHLYPQEVRVALASSTASLRLTGFAMVIVPDLEDVKATDDVLFDCPGGPCAAWT